eukprot:2852121-Pleurochrysis_carterae.AAC.1
MFWIIRQIYSGFIVQVQLRGAIDWLSEFGEERPEVGGFFRGFKSRYDLCLTGGQSYRGLFLAAPGNGSLPVHKNVSGRGMPRRPVGVRKTGERFCVLSSDTSRGVEQRRSWARHGAAQHTNGVGYVRTSLRRAVKESSDERLCLVDEAREVVCSRRVVTVEGGGHSFAKIGVDQVGDILLLLEDDTISVG